MKERAMCALPQTDSIFSLRKIELMAHGGYVRTVFFLCKVVFYEEDQGMWQSELYCHTEEEIK